MAKKKITLSLFSIAVLFFVLVGLILAIVGYFIDWVSVTTTTVISIPFVGEREESVTSVLTLANCNPEATGYGVMNTFAIMTLVFAGVAFVASAITTVVKKNKVVKIGLVLIDLLAIVFAIVALCCTYGYGGNPSKGEEGDIISVSVQAAPVAGAWLLAVGGIISGLFGGLSALKK